VAGEDGRRRRQPEGQRQASGWFRNLFEKKVEIVPGSAGGVASG
jgi:hypothetical protein